MKKSEILYNELLLIQKNILNTVNSEEVDLIDSLLEKRQQIVSQIVVLNEVIENINQIKQEIIEIEKQIQTSIKNKFEEAKKNVLNHNKDQIKTIKYFKSLIESKMNRNFESEV